MRPPRSCAAPQGYTLVEILVALTLTLIMMAAVVQIFGLVGESVSDSRATLEMNDRLRAATSRLQSDLAGVTATTLPPLSMADDPGYLEYVEGAVMYYMHSSGKMLAIDTSTSNPVATDDSRSAQPPDETVGDFDDILMFTTRSLERPFVGRLNGSPAESHVAEVAWFVRGGNLYRRVLLVLPAANVSGIARNNFYEQNDVSVRYENSQLVANSLGDLTRRENRYAHPTGTFPFDVREWGEYGLPTLGETCQGNWVSIASGTAPSNPWPTDFWTEPQPQDTSNGTRLHEDVILSNVIGFDVKAWDPAARVRDAAGNFITGAYGAYVDLGSTDATTFNNSYKGNSGLVRTYDTWTDYYETSTSASLRVNGFDDDNNGVVDNVEEGVTRAPYPVPLRGIQVKIRVFESDSRQIREVTVVQDFMPK